jgi:microcin C transport system substrate-binding protein
MRARTCSLLPLAAIAVWAATAMAPAAAQAPATSGPVEGFAMHGDVKYPPGFKHFDYVNPNAPKGGDVREHVIGTFDSFNPYILRGVPAAGIGGTLDTLMVASGDEPFTEYCLVCKTIEVPADRSWAEFTLRPEARFHDGTPITADDVIFSFEAIKTKGHPRWQSYYADVVKAEKLGPLKVRFVFKSGVNRELPLIIGQLPVFSKAWWSTRDFAKNSLEPPLGSGPYKIDSFEAGRYVVLRRVPDYWAANLPVNVGRNNFDTIRFDYYRDETVALEAFKAGGYDIRTEGQALAWATGYASPALAQGLIKKDEIPQHLTSGMQAYAMNIRRPMFQDRRVRAALGYAFDFEWSNRALFYGQYTRTRSYFDNSELAATGTPSPAELQLLEPWRGKIPDEVFTQEYDPPKTDGSGNIRDNLRAAMTLFQQAGYKVENGRMVGPDGRPLEFEILLENPQFERVTLPYVENLKRLGVTAHVRTVDPAQYQKRLDEFDFDMTEAVFPESQSPGNEQRSYWSSAMAGMRGSDNLIGIKDPAVDALVNLIVQAPSREDLVMRTRALDRILQWGFYVVPQWHLPVVRVAYWDRFSRPSVTPLAGYDQSTWWVDPQKDAALKAKRGR